MKRYTNAARVISVLLVATAIGCQKKTAVLLPPAPQKVEAAVAPTPKPNPPIIETFIADPGTVERGQSAALRWVVKDATQIEIDQGVGTVAAVGQSQVSPNDHTTYTIRATGPGGEATARAALAVTLPPTPVAVAPRPTFAERLSSEVRDIYFDFDRSGIRSDAHGTLSSDAEALKSIMSDFPTYTVILEGHCDERGSAEYNIALGDRRATAVKTSLSELGIPADRLQAISYGKERPQCATPDEACWQRNRRVHFTPGENQERRQFTTSGSAGFEY